MSFNTVGRGGVIRKCQQVQIVFSCAVHNLPAIQNIDCGFVYFFLFNHCAFFFIYSLKL